jgi:hypothetical protein
VCIKDFTDNAQLMEFFARYGSLFPIPEFFGIREYDDRE